VCLCGFWECILPHKNVRSLFGPRKVEGKKIGEVNFFPLFGCKNNVKKKNGGKLGEKFRKYNTK